MEKEKGLSDRWKYAQPSFEFSEEIFAKPYRETTLKQDHSTGSTSQLFSIRRGVQTPNLRKIIEILLRCFAVREIIVRSG